MSAVRTAVAVLLAGALLAVGLPAAEQARQHGAATRLDATTTALLSTADRLARESDPTRRAGARRTVVVRIPSGGSLRFDGAGAAWRIAGGVWHRRRGRVPLVAGDTPGVLGAGRHRLRLSLRRQDGEVVVVGPVRRPPADPEIEAGSRDQTPRVRRTARTAGSGDRGGGCGARGLCV